MTTSNEPMQPRYCPSCDRPTETVQREDRLVCLCRRCGWDEDHPTRKQLRDARARIAELEAQLAAWRERAELAEIELSER